MKNTILIQSYFKPSEIAQMLKITKQKVYADIRNGKLECTRLGDTIRISESQLMKYVGGSLNEQ